MALAVVGNKKFNPKAIAEEGFIKNTNMDQKMMGLYLQMNGKILREKTIEINFNVTEQVV